MADGGEGTTATLAQALGAELIQVEIQDALARPRMAHLAWNAKTRLTILEVAEACGLEHIEEQERNPKAATSFGVGTMILRALALGARRIVVGLGGSASNDAGAGMMRALGARLLDARGKDLPPGGQALSNLADMILDGLDPRLWEVTIQLACEVTNPLLGPSGASAIFGPQKGADETTVKDLDAALSRWAEVAETISGRSVRTVAGAGAAGGLGAAFMAFFDTEVCPGVELVLDTVGFDEKLHNAELVLTGEGSIDAQSSSGKVPWGLVSRARSHGVPTVVFGGRVSAEVELETPDGVLAFVPKDTRATPMSCIRGLRKIRTAISA